MTLVNSADPIPLRETDAYAGGVAFMQDCPYPVSDPQGYRAHFLLGAIRSTATSSDTPEQRLARILGMIEAGE